MKQLISIFTLTLSLSFLFTLSSCSPPQVTSALETVSTAATVGIGLTVGLESAKIIPPAIADQILEYAQAVNTAASKAARDEADPNLSPAQRIAAMATDFAGIAVPVVAPRYQPQVQALITAISSAVDVFLGQLQAVTAVEAAKTPQGAAVKLSAGDKAALKRVVANTEAGKKTVAARKRP